MPSDFTELDNPDFGPGTELESFEYKLTEGRVLNYIEATQDSNPWYKEHSPFGGPIAPATICDQDAMNFGALREVLSKKPGVLQASQEFEFINPARPGKKIKVTGKIADRYVRKGREYITIESLATDEDGRDICRTRNTQCWLAPEKEGQ